MVTNLTKNTASVKNQDRYGVAVWDDASVNWDDSLFSWDNKGAVITNTAKNTASVTNLTKT